MPDQSPPLAPPPGEPTDVDEPPLAGPRAWKWPWLLGVCAGLLLLVGGFAGGAAYARRDRTVDPSVTASPVSLVVGEVVEREIPDRTLEPYEGLGTWVDRFDYSPPYAGENPPIDAEEIAVMASLGVKTVYIQAAHRADRSPGLTEDPWVLAELLTAAHANDMAVVAWYLPKWEDEDLGKISAMADFEFLGHRFDGIGIDIEFNQDGLEPEERSRILVELSEGVREHVGDDPLSAIVLPPVLTEEVNTEFWPEFPWDDIAPLYDIWQPMSYWSFRSESSGYKNGYTYNAESTRLLRELLDDPNALVHGIGGIGAIDAEQGGESGGEPLAVVNDLEGFAQSLVDSNSVGGSMYDWATLDETARQTMAELFTTGTAASLPEIPGN